MASCPVPRLRERRTDIETAAIRMRRAATDRSSRGKQSVAVSGDVLAALDPAAVLQRGYAALQRALMRPPVFSVNQAEPGTESSLSWRMARRIERRVRRCRVHQHAVVIADEWCRRYSAVVGNDRHPG